MSITMSTPGSISLQVFITKAGSSSKPIDLVNRIHPWLLLEVRMRRLRLTNPDPGANFRAQVRCDSLDEHLLMLDRLINKTASII